MKYAVRCTECGQDGVVHISRTELPQLKAEGTECSECGGHAEYVFVARSSQINWAGDGWSDKNYREKEYRERRSVYMRERMRNAHEVKQLQPNYNGQRVDTWADARELARQDGKSHGSYDPLVARERKRKKG